jgi:hypothetical protein
MLVDQYEVIPRAERAGQLFQYQMQASRYKYGR